MPTEYTPDLAHPSELELGWRLDAACMASAFNWNAFMTCAERHGWYYDDGSGTTARMVLLDGGRAVLTGWERAFTHTTDHGIDVVATAPDWVRRVVRMSEPIDPAVGFIAWFEDGRWHAHEYPEDGLERWVTSRGFGTTEGRRELVNNILDVAADEHLQEDDPREEALADDAAIARVLDEGYSPTREALLAMLVFEELNLDAAADAIRAFRDVTPLSLEDQAPSRG